eukprot:8459737-Pyramimonas_sp.AAC.1
MTSHSSRGVGPPKSGGHASLRVVIWPSVGLVRLRNYVRDCASCSPSNPRSISLNSTGHCNPEAALK